MPKMSFAEGMSYLTQKSKIRLISLPNVSLQTNLNIELQPQCLLVQLIGVFCSKFEFQSIYKAKLLITVHYTKIDP